MKITAQLLKCLIGLHDPGKWRPAFGNREIKVCLCCDKLVAQRQAPRDGRPADPPRDYA